jgi:ligand-binding SRPBCC domain-containing protein
MQKFSFRTQLVLPRKRDEIFRFFADARNLEVLTPPWLRFCVLTPPPIKTHPGTLIDYKLRVHGIPLKWRSEITAWEPPTCFVDEQRRGPYRTWIYEHRFEESGKGTLCTDFVRYSVFGGAVINWLLYAAMLRKSLHFEPDNCGSSFARPAK